MANKHVYKLGSGFIFENRLLFLCSGSRKMLKRSKKKVVLMLENKLGSNFINSEIIFKCVNSTVRPIFNEKVSEK